MKYLSFWLAASVVFTGCKAQAPSFRSQQSTNTLLWEVSGNGLKKPSFLFGTFHLMCKEDISFSSQLKKAVAYCDEVYMEMDMDDPSVMLSGMMYMNMKGDKTLKDLYSEEDYKKVTGYLTDSLKVPVMLLERAKPYFLIALLFPKMMDCKTPAGIEEELVKIAKENKKEINGLETMQFQASVFDSIPYEWQAGELLKNIDSVAFYKNEFRTMLRFYKNQQLDSLEALINKPDEDAGKYNDLLLTSRNRNWVATLDEVMKKESVFVAVGAGHLAGEEGLITLLKKKGYRVQPLVNK